MSKRNVTTDEPEAGSPTKGKKKGGLSKFEEEQRKSKEDIIRNEVIVRDIKNDQIYKQVKEFTEATETISDPLKHEMVWGTDQEWSNIPMLVAKYCIYNQAHLHSIIGHCHDRSKEETTKALRTYVEKKNA